MGLVAELHLRPRSGIKRKERLEEEQGRGEGAQKADGISLVKTHNLLLQRKLAGCCRTLLSAARLRLRSRRSEKHFPWIPHSQRLQPAVAALHILEQPVHSANIELAPCEQRLVSPSIVLLFRSRRCKHSAQIAAKRLIRVRRDNEAVFSCDQHVSPDSHARCSSRGVELRDRRYRLAEQGNVVDLGEAWAGEGLSTVGGGVAGPELGSMR